MSSKKVFVTGGAGFIGSNYVADLIRRGDEVTIYDNLSRPGVSYNIDWLNREFGADVFRLIVGDVRDADKLEKEIGKPDVVAHFAAQVAVTTSVVNPREDFEINAFGTFNVLEAVRKYADGRMRYTLDNYFHGGNYKPANTLLIQALKRNQKSLSRGIQKTNRFARKLEL